MKLREGAQAGEDSWEVRQTASKARKLACAETQPPGAHIAAGAELGLGSHSKLSANPSCSQDKSDKLCSSSRDTLGTRGLGRRSDSRSLIRVPEGLACTAVSKCQHGLRPTLP